MKKKLLILSFVIPLLIYLFAFYVNSFFSDKTFLIGDAEVQYFPLFNYFKCVLEGSKSIFYNFSKGLGGTMWGTFAYYLSSPFNLLLYFINEDHIVLFMSLLTVFKLSLCGLTMYIYMSHKFKDSYLVLVFSILYAFTGYNLNYFINIMWLDTIFLAPLILLGIDKILDNKSPILYIICLTFSIISNYYIGYIMCIFCVIYFIYEALLNNKFNKKMIINFLIPSILSGLMASVIIVPSILEMLTYGRTSSLKDIFGLNFNLFNLFAKSYIGATDYVAFNNYALNVYCGIIIIPLVYLYLINKKIDKKERILTLIVILTMILPVFINVIDYIWHLFTFTMGYGYRYSFLLCLFLIRIAYKSVNNLNFKKEDILSYLAVYISYSVIIIFVSYFKDYFPYLNHKIIWLTIFILIINLILLYYKPKNFKNIIATLLLIETFLNVNIYLARCEPTDTNSLYNNYVVNLANNYSGRIGIEIQNIDTGYTGDNINENLLGNFLSTNLFLSTTNENHFKSNHYLLNNTNKYEYTNFNIFNDYSHYIADSLLGVTTIIKDTNKSDYKYIKEENGLYVFENEFALSLGYMVSDKCNNIYKNFYSEDALNCLINEENNFYKEYELISKNNNTYQYKINKGYYYIYLDDIDKHYKEIESINRTSEYILGLADEDKIITLNFEDEVTNLKLYYFDYELFKEKIKKLKEEQLEYTISKDTLTGTITTKGGVLLLTIPYEKGLNIYVDNKKVNYFKALDTLVAINLESGTHDIKITYNQPGLKLGIIMSVISLILTTIYVKKTNKY